MRLLVAIPIFNELKYVRSVLAKVRRYHDQILVVDDGSTDGTGPLLADLAAAGSIQLLRHPANRGYGQSIIDAFHYADAHGYDWVITMDCDEQHEPEMIPRFVHKILTDRWDVISGSRYLHPRKDDDLPPGDRRAINATITSVLNGLFSFGITDAFCGFKAHRVSAMMQLKLDEPGYAFPMQFWPRAAAMNLRITEIPVRLIYNDPTRHFGGMLDDASRRLAHYLEVLNREMKWRPPTVAKTPEASVEPPEAGPADVCTCCCHD
ncbi:glycosyltransferase family 2 protein [Fontivita pretiosa]|uniref:glycosyltransferase family 2 protein n=1 Tax=Fontivita pretiosa TaxID=2989684 RepID=UPI003D16EC0C